MVCATKPPTYTGAAVWVCNVVTGRMTWPEKLEKKHRAFTPTSCPLHLCSFGVMLWELYMTRRPYAGSNAMQVCAAKLLHKTTLDFAPGTPPAYKVCCFFNVVHTIVHAVLQALAEQCMGPVEQRPSLDTIVQGLQDIQQQLELGSLSAAAFPAWEVRAALCGNVGGAFIGMCQDPEEEQARACAWDVENDTSSSSGGEVHRTVQVMAATN